MRVNFDFRRVAPAACACLLACGDQAADPSLVHRRDSAGVEIVEALRPLWDDVPGWTIDPEPLVDLAVTGSGPNHEFGQVIGMARLSDGSLALVDRLWSEIRRYSAEGDFLNSTGREGEGPGEYQQIELMDHARADTLLVLDFGGRVTVLGPDLSLLRTFDLPPLARPIFALDDGTMVVQMGRPFSDGSEALDRLLRIPRALWRFGTTGERLDSIGRVAGAEIYLAYGGRLSVGPLFGKVSQVATGGGRIFRGESDEMQVEELSPAGDLIRVLRIPDFPLALTDEQVRAERDAYGGDIGEALPTPATRPAYERIVVDASGALWLRRYRGMSERDEADRWYILGADGVWLGSIVLPERFEVLNIETDAVLGVWRDELDVEHPQVLRLERN